jgi:hypothetical protein
MATELIPIRRVNAVRVNGDYFHAALAARLLMNSGQVIWKRASRTIRNYTQSVNYLRMRQKTRKRSKKTMNKITLKDGKRIYYKDWGTGKPVVFSHGWPLSTDTWDAQMLLLVSNGYRCIAHDRRGHVRSSQPWDGNNMDTYAAHGLAYTHKNQFNAYLLAFLKA